MSIFSWFGNGKAAAEVKGGEPALTPEGAAHGLSWDTAEDANYSADLYYEGEMKAGVFDGYGRENALVDVFDGKTLGGISLGGNYPTLQDGMRAAEDYTLHELGAIDVQPLADASESYHARLTAMAERKGAAMDRDAGDGKGFDVER